MLESESNLKVDSVVNREDAINFLKSKIDSCLQYDLIIIENTDYSLSSVENNAESIRLFLIHNNIFPNII